MINLLDADVKREIRAARMNVTLLAYCIIVGIVFVFATLLALFSYWWLNNRIEAARDTQASNITNTSGYASVRARANAYSANLSAIQAVLAQRSDYSTALYNIAASLPAGATLSTVAFAPTFLTTPLTISATTSDYPSAVALSQKLATSPIYSKVSLNNANCNGGEASSSSTAAKSGCDVSITATLNNKVFLRGATQ